MIGEEKGEGDDDDDKEREKKRGRLRKNMEMKKTGSPPHLVQALYFEKERKSCPLKSNSCSNFPPFFPSKIVHVTRKSIYKTYPFNIIAIC